jgi:2-polyprenyl-3-methyl-5-hydroxy-6-metoxy-1,4-benzoquinol methylase
LPEAILGRYGDGYLEYETARHLEYRAIALRSLAEAGLRLDDAHDAEGRARSALEIGCATGALLSSFDEAGWKAIGIEAGPSMAAYARSHFGLDVRAGTIESTDLPEAEFDAVVATHLIEHLNDPRSFLRLVRKAMRPDGALYLVTPNADGFQARLMGSAWRSAIRDHLYLFSRRTLKALLASEGFSVEYLGTWGGWPAGMEPRFLKRPVDGLAKLLGLGDVMILRSKSIR